MFAYVEKSLEYSGTILDQGKQIKCRRTIKSVYWGVLNCSTTSLYNAQTLLLLVQIHFNMCNKSSQNNICKNFILK